MFGRKKKIKFETKYKLDEFVFFKYKDELKFGRVQDIRKKEDKIVYDVCVGGECPVILTDIDEAILFTKEEKK